MSKLSIHASLVLLSLLSLSSAIAVDIFNQPTTYPNVCAGCWTSHTSTGKNGFQAFESFALSSTQRMSEVRWQGLYWDSIKAANNPVAPITTTWEISIWSDAAGAPGVQLYVETKPFADVSSILVGNTVMDNGDTVPVFDFCLSSGNVLLGIGGNHLLGTSPVVWTGLQCDFFSGLRHWRGRHDVSTGVS